MQTSDSLAPSLFQQVQKIDRFVSEIWKKKCDVILSKVYNFFTEKTRDANKLAIKEKGAKGFWTFFLLK